MGSYGTQISSESAHQKHCGPPHGGTAATLIPTLPGHQLLEGNLHGRASAAHPNLYHHLYHRLPCSQGLCTGTGHLGDGHAVGPQLCRENLLWDSSTRMKGTWRWVSAFSSAGPPYPVSSTWRDYKLTSVTIIFSLSFFVAWKLASKSSREAPSTKMKLKYLISMGTVYHGRRISPKISL